LIAWRKQGTAIVGEVTLVDGRSANVVVVGCAQNPKGAALVLPGEKGSKPTMNLFPAAIELLRPSEVVEILCMQERAFGKRGLPAPEGLS